MDKRLLLQPGKQVRDRKSNPMNLSTNQPSLETTKTPPRELKRSHNSINLLVIPMIAIHSLLPKGGFQWVLLLCTSPCHGGTMVEHPFQFACQGGQNPQNAIYIAQEEPQQHQLVILMIAIHSLLPKGVFQWVLLLCTGPCHGGTPTPKLLTK